MRAKRACVKNQAAPVSRLRYRDWFRRGRPILDATMPFQLWQCEVVTRQGVRQAFLFGSGSLLREKSRAG